MKSLAILITFFILGLAHAQNCDVRVGTSVGVKVVEFASGNVVHSKMPLKETTPEAMLEEMVSLQDMSICQDKIISKKCLLRIEKKSTARLLTLYRGQDRWLSWLLPGKLQAQEFVKRLQRAGFCI